MSYELLRKEIKEGTTRGLYLFYGPEDYLASYYAKEIGKLVAGPDSQDAPYTVFDEKIDYSALYGACTTYSFFGGRRMIVLKHCGLFSRGADEAQDAPKSGAKRNVKGGSKGQFEEILHILPDHVCLLVIEREVDRRAALFSLMKEKGLVVEFTYRPAHELANWAKAIAGREGARFSTDALNYFIGSAGESMTQIRQELDKLLMYAAGRREITADDINNVCSLTLKVKIFALLDEIVSGRKKHALAELDLLLRDREPPMRILSTLSNHLILLKQFKELSDGGVRLPEAVKITGVNQYRAEKMWRQCAPITGQAISKAVEQCHKLDAAIKVGQASDEPALQFLVASIDMRA